MLPDTRSRSGTIVVVAAAVAFAGLIVWSIFRDREQQPTLTPGAPTHTSGESGTPGSTLAGQPVEVFMVSSDTKEDWLNALVADFNAKQVRTSSDRPIVVRVEHGRSGDSKDAIVDGVITPTVWSPGDQSWAMVLNEEWQDLHPGQTLIPDACQPTVYAPVGFAMWRPMAEAMGWPATPIGWDEIVALAADPQGWGRYGHPEWRQFKFGHTDPRISNSGLLLLTALAYAEWDVRGGLTVEMVKSDKVIQAMRTVELHTYHYGRQSRENVIRMIQNGPDFLHATNASEAETLRANQGKYGEAQFPLAFIFPADGAFWAEQPYCVLDADWVDPEQHEAAQLFEEYLHERPQQELAVGNYLRPTDPDVPLHDPFTLDNGTDPNETTSTTPALESPAPAALNAVQDIFVQTKRNSTVILLLDTSGSMAGDKIKNAVEGAAQFVEAMERDDEIYVYPFADSVTKLAPSGGVGDAGEELAGKLRSIFAGGGTSLHDAICEATARVKGLRARDEAAGDPRLYGIVVLSDGNDTTSTNTKNDVLNVCLPGGEEAVGVRVFTIAYGEDANKGFLTSLANRTDGKAYDADPTSILAILLGILYQ